MNLFNKNAFNASDYKLIPQILICLSYRCNYSCSYCMNQTGIESNIIADQWIDIINRKILGSNLHFSGGEPTLYPDFINIVKEVKNNVISFTTNISDAAFNCIESISSSQKIGEIICSYHPENEDILCFSKKLIELQKMNFKIKYISIVALPGFLEEMPTIIEKLQNLKIPIRIFAYRLDAKCYSYSSRQKYTLKKILKCSILPDIEEEIINHGSINNFGKECLCGSRLIFVRPDGNIQKCSSDKRIISNIINGFIFTNKSRCTYKQCLYGART